MISKGSLHRPPLLFIPEALCLKNARASADNAYFISHLAQPHISYPAKQVPGDLDNGFVGHHPATILFVQHCHSRILAYDRPTALHNGRPQVFIASVSDPRSEE